MSPFPHKDIICTVFAFLSFNIRVLWYDSVGPMPPCQGSSVRGEMPGFKMMELQCARYRRRVGYSRPRWLCFLSWLRWTFRIVTDHLNSASFVFLMMLIDLGRRPHCRSPLNPCRPLAPACLLCNEPGMDLLPVQQEKGFFKGCLCHHTGLSQNGSNLRSQRLELRPWVNRHL